MACHAYTYEHDCEVCPHLGTGAALKAFRRCKNPCHKDFMTIAEFVEKGTASMNRERLSDVWDMINRTVRISLFKTSANRPDTYPDSSIPYPLKEIRGNCYYMRHGTGFLVRSVPTRQQVDVDVPAGKCSCFGCKTSKKQPANPQFSRYFLISTATHVVFDDFEVESCSIDFFYDSEDRKGVVTIYGVRVFDEETKRLDTDQCRILCVTHDIEVAERFSWIDDHRPLRVRSVFEQDVLISHPHGVSKRISLGHFTSAKRVVMMNERKSPVVLREGLRIRLRGKADVVHNIMKTLGFEPDNVNNGIESDQDVNRKTFILTRDVTVSFPLRISVEHDIENDEYNDITSINGRKDWWCKDRWWTFPLGMEMAAECGISCRLPCGKDEDTVVMEVYIRGSLFETPFLCRREDGGTSTVFDVEKAYYNYYTYSMACCKGSSGGAIIQRNLMGSMSFPEVATHFGSLGQSGTCGLVENRFGLECFQFVTNLIRDAKEYFPDLDETFVLKYCQSNGLPKVQLDTPKKRKLASERALIRVMVKVQTQNVCFPANFFSSLGIAIPQGVVETEEGRHSLIDKFFSVLMAEIVTTKLYGEESGAATTTGSEQHSTGDVLVAEMEKDFPYAIPAELKTKLIEGFFSRYLTSDRLSSSQKPKDWWSRIKETFFNISAFLYEKRDVLCACCKRTHSTQAWPCQYEPDVLAQILLGQIVASVNS